MCYGKKPNRIKSPNKTRNEERSVVMKADAYEVTKVLGYDRQLIAPLFQRPYVWKKDEQWEPLWNDIRRLAELLMSCKDEKDAQKIKPHFLGAVVLDQYRVSVGKPDTRSIIDGQQRLTTLQLFLVAFRDCLRTDDKYDKQARKLERFLFNEDVEDDADRYKVLPTNIDRPPYKAVMNAGSPAALQTMSSQQNMGKDARVIEAYTYFHGVIGNWIDFAGDDNLKLARIDSLANVIREKIRFVVIDMDDQDDAQAIFETLNARGTPLLPSDLIKNFLFKQAQIEQADMVHLYENHWLEFENDDRFWRHEVGIGHAKRPRIDLYLQHYLTLKTSKEIQVGHIFVDFCAFAEKQQKSVDWHLTNLQDYARHFKTFMLPPPDTQECTFLQRLETMQFVTVYPFLLELFKSTENNKVKQNERVAILDVVESFLVRRMVCRLSTRGYNTLFLNLLSHLKGKEYNRNSVVTFLLNETAESGRFPSDQEFKDAWLGTPIYQSITRPRLKMVLEALDQTMHTSKTEPYKINGALTVEHFLPQHWETHWKMEPAKGESAENYLLRKERRNTLLHTFGNLTLLTNALNPDVSNGSFRVKRDKILKYSVLNISRFLNDLPSWDEDSIIERGKQLFKVACKIWPYPS